MNSQLISLEDDFIASGHIQANIGGADALNQDISHSSTIQPSGKPRMMKAMFINEAGSRPMTSHECHQNNQIGQLERLNSTGVPVK
jgi:hypothetical protein